MASLIRRFFKREHAGAPLPIADPTLGPAPLVPTSAAPASTQNSRKSFDSLCADAEKSMGANDFWGAVEFYDRAIAINPSAAEPHYKRANALRELGRMQDAVDSYDRAIARRPNYAYAYCNRGVVLRSLGRTDAAIASYDQAIELDPADAMAHFNRAILMQEISRWQDALTSYEQAIEREPQFAEARYNRSMLKLFLGDFASGWPEYEWRWANASRLGIGERRTFLEPRWSGEPIAGKRLLLYGEGGLGDVLQFSRYATCCARLGATVIVQAHAQLHALLGRLEGVSDLVDFGAPLPPFDCQCPLMSLPMVFGTTVDNIPAAQGYLTPSASRIAWWQARIGERRRPRIGLVWSGNAKNPNDARRSVALNDWLPWLPEEFQYFRLQTPISDADRAVLEQNRRIVSFQDEWLDFENTAALCSCLDLVLTVDTSLAHLGGALGCRTWILLSNPADFRWLSDREDSPWYRSIRLYRQSRPGHWLDVFETVESQLRLQFEADPAS